MLYEPMLAHQMAKARVEDILREAEQADLVRTAKGPKPQTWRLPIASIFSNLLALFFHATKLGIVTPALRAAQVSLASSGLSSNPW